jgi:hypothetical protein
MLGVDLENYAAVLARVAEDQVVEERVVDARVAELWMMEAQPAYSAEFRS